MSVTETSHFRADPCSDLRGKVAPIIAAAGRVAERAIDPILASGTR